MTGQVCHATMDKQLLLLLETLGYRE